MREQYLLRNQNVGYSEKHGTSNAILPDSEEKEIKKLVDETITIAIQGK